MNFSSLLHFSRPALASGTGSFLVAAALALPGSPARAVSIVQVSAADFSPAAGLITFSEYPIGTINPAYAPADYGGVAGQPTVNFAGYFLGQALSANAAVDCPGGNPDGCVSGTPSSPLSLSPSSPDTFISLDGANPDAPVLSGSPQFNGPISVLFDRDMAGVGLEAGFFNAIGGTAIKVYDRFGTLLGQTSNSVTGIQFLGLASSDGSEVIRGLEFSLIGPEEFGYAIDNLRFALSGQLVPGPLPLTGAAAAWAFSRRLRRRIRRSREH